MSGFGLIEHDDEHSTEVGRLPGSDPVAWHAGCTCGWTFDGPNYWVAGNAARAHTA